MAEDQSEIGPFGDAPIAVSIGHARAENRFVIQSGKAGRAHSAYSVRCPRALAAVQGARHCVDFFFTSGCSSAGTGPGCYPLRPHVLHPAQFMYTAE